MGKPLRGNFWLFKPSFLGNPGVAVSACCKVSALRLPELRMLVSGSLCNPQWWSRRISGQVFLNQFFLTELLCSRCWQPEQGLFPATSSHLEQSRSYIMETDPLSGIKT